MPGPLSNAVGPAPGGPPRLGPGGPPPGGLSQAIQNLPPQMQMSMQSLASGICPFCGAQLPIPGAGGPPPGAGPGGPPPGAAPVGPPPGAGGPPPGV